MDTSAKFLSDLAFYRTYSATKADGTKETWEETTERYKQMMLGKFPQFDDTIGFACELIKQKLIVPSMRSLQFAGPAILSNNIRLFNCFQADTEFLTKSGLRKFSDCVDGEEVTVLADRHRWKIATVRSYSEQRLYKLSVVRGRTIQEIYTTADHQWIKSTPCGNTAKRSVVTTLELKPNDILPTNRLTIDLKSPCRVGVQHGMVFGDGTFVKADGSCLIDLWDESTDFVSLFSTGEIIKQGERGGVVNTRHVTIRNLPYNWKQLPPLTANKDYLVGFLMGWMATDGNCSGTIGISSAVKENLEWLRNACAILGIGTGNIAIMREVSPFDGSSKPLYRINFFKESLFKEFFIKKSHKEKFTESDKTLRWKVQSVEETDKVEKVWCVTEPDTHTFTLGCGILTHNCSFLPISYFRAFAEVTYLLMCGVGVGCGIRSHEIAKLPVITEGDSEVEPFVVADSKAGWADSMIELLYNPKQIFDYSQVSPNGTVITCGTASGPEPLQQAHEEIRKILLKAVGRQMVAEEVADIYCFIGEAIIVGGVRRSAGIILFDQEEMMQYKSGDWWVKNPQRAMVNVSRCITRDGKEDVEISSALDFMQENKSGEPGYALLCNNNNGLNPCQPAFATVLTPDGIRTFSDIGVGSTIWSGKQWTKVTHKWSTGIKPVCRYQTTSGEFIGTKNHRVVEKGIKKEVKEVNGIDVCLCPVSGIEGLVLDPADIMDGLVIGDGTVHKASNNLVVLCIGSKDIDYHNSEVGSLIKKERKGVGPYAWEVETSVTVAELPRTWLRVIPARFYNGTVPKKLGFLRGLFSANGTVTAGRISFKTTSKPLIYQVAEMLASVGIRASIATNRATDIEHHNGTFTSKEAYTLNIYSHGSLFLSQIGFLQQYKMGKQVRNTDGRSVPKLVEVIPLGEMEVFDITVEAEEHTYWTGGCLVSNCGEALLRPYTFCNLTEINYSEISDETELAMCAGMAAFLGILQSTFTDFPYLRDSWKLNTEEDRLIGVSLTGIAQNMTWGEAVPASALIFMQSVIQETCSKLGLSLPKRITLVKPSGTTSAVLATSSGIHAPFSEYHIRRVQMDKESPVAKELMKLCPVEEAGAGWFLEQHNRNPNSIVASIPIHTKARVYADTEPAISALERIITIQRNWIHLMHREGEDRHNCSATVYYKPEEMEEVKQFLIDNKEDYVGISLFPYSDSNMPQLPFEKISKEKYEELLQMYEPYMIDLSSVNYTGTADARSGEAACAGGACEFK